MFSPSLLSDIINTCTQLIDLNLDSILKVNDDLVLSISQNCPNIQRISLEVFILFQSVPFIF